MDTTDLNEELIKEMAGAGVLYGHKRTKTHPKMKPFIALTRNDIEMIDPEATISSLEKAIVVLNEKIKSGGLILIVGTIPPAKEAVLKFAEEFNFPFVINRWLGGTLTNFKVISNRGIQYQDLKSQKEKNELAKYTKKEQHRLSEKINKLSRNFEGLIKLGKVPDVLFVVDPEVHDTAVREAKRLKIPIVAILDSNDNPSQIDYPIFGNDHAKLSIDWIFARILEGLKKS